MSLCDSCRSYVPQFDQHIHQVCHTLGGSPCLPCSQVKDLEEKVQQAQLFTNRLLAQIHALKEKMNQQHDPFIHRLPPEVASYIFILTLPRSPSVHVFDEVPQNSRDEEYIRPVPFILAAVCRRWRQIALRTPQLWTVLSMNLTSYSPSPSTRSELVETWLTRTGDLQLYIRLFFFQFDPFSPIPQLTEDLLGPIIDVIKRFTHRCVVLDLRLPTELFVRFHGGQVCSVMENLRIDPYEALIGFPNTRLDVDFKLAASSLHLRRLSTHRVSLRNIYVHRNHLTKFDGIFLLQSECIELLRDAPNMVECDMTFVTAENDIPIPTSTHIVHRSLQSLRLDTFPKEFWNYFTVPSLLMLHTCVWNAESQANLIAFMKRSGCALVDVRIGKEDDDYVDSLIELLELQSMSSLKRLMLIGVVLTNNFLQHFGQTAKVDGLKPEEKFLPHLEDFHLCARRAFDWSFIPSMLPNPPLEKDGCRPLSSIRIELFVNDWDYGSTPEYEEEDVIDPESLASIQEVIDSGFSLRIEDARERDMVVRARRLHELSDLGVDEEGEDEEVSDGEDEDGEPEEGDGDEGLP